METVSTSVGDYCGISTLISAIILILPCILFITRQNKIYSGFELYGEIPGDIFGSKAREQYLRKGGEVVRDGLAKCKERAFQIITATGPIIILPPSVVDNIRNDERLTLSGFLEHEFMSEYPGMEPWKGLRNRIFQDVVKKNLTAAIGPLTPALSLQMARLAQDLFPSSSTEWLPLPFLPTIVPVVAQMTTKVFTGEPLCHDPEWLQISINFTIQATAAQAALRSWPAILRPLVFRFLPEMRQIRQSYEHADSIIGKEMRRRHATKKKAAADGTTVPKYNDALEWFGEVAAGEEYSIVQGQLLLSFAAIHTTSMTLYAFMFDVLSEPEIIPELREEIIAVLREDGGLTKTSLYKLKLLDSCLKESQRISPFGPTSLHRLVEEPVTLPNGTRLPKGAITAVPSCHMHNPDVYGADPLKFDGHRYHRLRQQPGQENRGQFVTTSADHFGFGHGKFACPGRFLAANALKIMLVHMLLRYDWKPEDGGAKKSLTEGELRPDPSARILCRSRTPEIEL